MKRELAKDRGLSFGIQDRDGFANPDAATVSLLHNAWKKMSEAGKSPRISCAPVERVTADRWCRLQLR
jgi:hypothetical protein